MAADPYLAVTLDAKRRIAQAARALDQPHPGPALWGLLELLEDVWRRKDPAVSAMVLAACFGPDSRWPAALVSFRFLAPAPATDSAGWVLHPDEADRLLLTHAKRVAAGKARADGAKRGAHGRLQRSTSTSPAHHEHVASGAPAEHQLLQPAASSQQPAAEKKKHAGAADAAPRPGWQALIDRLTSTYQRILGAKYDFRGHDARALREMLDRGVVGEAIEAAWERALRTEGGYPLVRTLVELNKHLNHFLGAARAAPVGDLRKGTVRAEDQDHLHGPAGEHPF